MEYKGRSIPNKLKDFIPTKEVLHTQGEWKIDTANEPDYPIYEGEECVLTVWASSQAEQLAELICKAVNDYPATQEIVSQNSALLIERQRLIDSNRDTVVLLERVVKELEKYGNIGRDMLPEFNDLINNAKNILP